MASIEQKIHEQTMRIMSEIGVRIVNDRALQIYKDNGVRIEGDTVFFTEEEIMGWIHMAPETFKIYGRNPKYDIILGGDHVNPAPTYGCAFIDDPDGTHRTGTMEDYVKTIKLVQAEDAYKLDGGITIKPDDVATEYASVEMFYAMLTHTDKCLVLPTGYKNEMECMLEASCALFGGKEALIEKPRMIALVNTVSPLTLDDRMLDSLMLLAEYGQPAILCPASMLGSTSPLFMVGTLASNGAEVLAGIALAQMIRPGTPCVFGIQSTAADFCGLTFACAAPEGAVMQGFGRNMGRFYGLPSRGGGCQTDSPFLNVQAGYESMFTLFSSYHSGINVVLEAGGTMDSVNSMSFEKMVVDFEILRQVQFVMTPIRVDEETLCWDDIEEAGQTGNFVMSDSTLDNYQDELYVPHIGLREAKRDDPGYFNRSVAEEIENLLRIFDGMDLAIDPEIDAKIRTALAKSGAPMADFEKIAAL